MQGIFRNDVSLVSITRDKSRFVALNMRLLFHQLQS